MTFLIEPFATDFMLRALAGGALVAVLCGLVGTWVVTRGMAFLGEAMAHGVLPGVALASLLGAPTIVGAAVSAALMSVGVSVVERRWRLSADTSIGLLFVASLALGVVIISSSRTFATDATAILFGDILAVQPEQLGGLTAAVVVTAVMALVWHRAFVALAVDPRQAQLLRLRPRLAQAVLVGLVALAVVSAYQAVGSLLVLGMLLGPAVAAARWTTRIPTTMALAGAIGSLSVWIGLLVSWHAGTAAGATIALVAVMAAPVSAVARAAITARRANRATPSVAGPTAAAAAPAATPAATAEAAAATPVQTAAD